MTDETYMEMAERKLAAYRARRPHQSLTRRIIRWIGSGSWT